MEAEDRATALAVVRAKREHSEATNALIKAQTAEAEALSRLGEAKQNRTFYLARKESEVMEAVRQELEDAAAVSAYIADINRHQHG